MSHEKVLGEYCFIAEVGSWIPNTFRVDIQSTTTSGISHQRKDETSPVLWYYIMDAKLLSPDYSQLDLLDTSDFDLPSSLAHLFISVFLLFSLEKSSQSGTKQMAQKKQNSNQKPQPQNLHPTRSGKSGMVKPDPKGTSLAADTYISAAAQAEAASHNVATPALAGGIAAGPLSMVNSDWVWVTKTQPVLNQQKKS
ncbi:hypothetical protein BDP27DRAFT_1422878 [Rhodocollybia butyracea]|uniref:Uncharacterized protein n=1 Tax=Rhodocollybia butyracea TaxID=206335 RepID=A0A9P5PQB4_9AGAR|nr:hypothetical protein BDP27DRAFT_1422878 [Rhodocollybia butyracea]